MSQEKSSRSALDVLSGVAVVGLGALISLTQNNVFMAQLPHFEGARASNKPYSNFNDFYPFYLKGFFLKKIRKLSRNLPNLFFFSKNTLTSIVGSCISLVLQSPH